MNEPVLARGDKLEQLGIHRSLGPGMRGALKRKHAEHLVLKRYGIEVGSARVMNGNRLPMA